MKALFVTSVFCITLLGTQISCSKVDSDQAESIKLLQRSEDVTEQPSAKFTPDVPAQQNKQPSSDSMVLDIISGGKIVYRFLDVAQWGAHREENDEHLTRSGYGILDANQDYIVDEGELRVYFEFNDQNIKYLFYQNPINQTPR